MDILLITPSNEKLGKFRNFVPRSVPIALGILANYLMIHNYEPEIVDEEIIKIDKAFLVNKIEEMSTPRVFGISAMTTNINKAYKISKIIKEIDKNAIVIMGGIHPTVAPEEVLKNGYIDFVVRGEGEKATLALLQEIKGDNKNFDSIKGISYLNEASEITHNQEDPVPFDVDELSIFPYEFFDEKYYDLGFILTSRGCPFNCIFCSQRVITKGKYRYRNNDLVIAELDYLINKRGQKSITFFDDFFTGNKKRVFELCKLIRDNELHKKCSFGVQTRGDSIDKEILEEMKRSGFNNLMFGFETASNHLMKVINKKETVEDNINAIKLAKELGFVTEATFIFGFPEESYEDRIKALLIAKEVGLDRARFNIATPYPGTEFYQIALSQNKLNQEEEWSNFNSVGTLTIGLFDKYEVPYCPDGTNPTDLTGEVFLANLLFYLNPKHFKKLLNMEKSASTKWFEFSRDKVLNLKVLLDFSSLALTILLRSIYYIIFSKECRKFFLEGLLVKEKLDKFEDLTSLSACNKEK